MAKTKRFCILLLRILALSATLTATIVMATSSQTTSIYGISFEAKYSFTPAFKFFMIANAIVSVYGFLVLFLPSESLLWRLVVALDVIITMLVTSSIAAALAIAYVGKKGNDHAGWLPICNQVPKFCDRVTGALAAGFIATIIYLFILLHSIHTVLNPLLV